MSGDRGGRSDPGVGDAERAGAEDRIAVDELLKELDSDPARVA